MRSLTVPSTTRFTAATAERGSRGGGIASFTWMRPRPFDSTISMAPSWRRSRTARTKFLAAICTRSMSMGEPRSTVRTTSASS